MPRKGICLGIRVEASPSEPEPTGAELAGVAERTGRRRARALRSSGMHENGNRVRRGRRASVLLRHVLTCSDQRRQAYPRSLFLLAHTPAPGHTRTQHRMVREKPRYLVRFEDATARALSDPALRGGEGLVGLSRLRQEFDRQWLLRFEDGLASLLDELPVATGAERQGFTSYLDRLLQEHDLRLTCPATKRPAALIANPEDGLGEGDARFWLEVNEPNGTRVTTHFLGRPVLHVAFANRTHRNDRSDLSSGRTR